MQQQYDYYKILQVHNLAEPEIIDSAYKRLVRKYHPDVNPGADTMEMIQMINEAYSVLKDPAKRISYNCEWEKIHHRSESSTAQDYRSFRGIEKMFVPAKYVLDDYFNSIRNKNYACCYELISELDKRNISKKDFIHWQEAVSKIYQLKEYNCEFYGVYRDKLLNGVMYRDVLEFNIKTKEYNTVMDLHETDHCLKTVVAEEGTWRVFIGYEKLQPIINKFKNLNGLLNAKSVINELAQQHIKVDVATGLSNQRGLIEILEREIQRHDRYGNIFAMIICELDIVKLINPEEEKEVIDSRMKTIGELLISNLRKLDVTGRWSNKALLIILPETGLLQAIKVSHKIERLLKDKHLAITDTYYKMVVNFGIAEYTLSLEDALDRMYAQLR
jgi:diguanylate cyclase (GGDEF)-like protein